MQVSNDNKKWDTIATIKDNKDSSNLITLDEPTKAQYVKFVIEKATSLDPNNSKTDVAMIRDIKIYGENK